MDARAPRPRFVGDTLRLNKLNVPVPDGVVPPANAPEEVSLQELFECCAEGVGSPNLHNVLATSYGCDYSFVDSLVHGSPADLSGRVTIFDNQNDHFRKMGGFDESTYPRRTVVMPQFHSYDSTQAERMRMRRGTMHPKLIILEFRAVEGAPCDRFLRLIVSSANLGRYDAKVNNQFWVHDFPPRVHSATPRTSEPEDGSSICPVCQESIDATECQECAMTIRCACTRHHDWGEEFCGDCSVRTALHHDLCRFLIHLFGPTREERPGMYLSWRSLLAAFDLTPPPGVHLIMSVPGRHREGDHVGWGQWALAHKLQQGVAESASHPKVAAIEYALSSCGRVEDFRQELWRTFRTGAESAAPVRIVWPTVSMASVAMHLRRRAAADSRSAARRAAADGRAEAGAEDGEEEEEEEAPGLTIDGRTSIMYGPNDQVCRELRGDLAEHLPAFAHRRGALHHIKMAAGLTPDAAAADAGPGDGTPLCSWVYLGSHNLSGAAWGKLEEVQRKDLGAEAEPRREYVILSYELGVLIIPAEPRRFPLPWVSPARSYGTIGREGVLPFSTARYLSLLHGRGSQSSNLPTQENGGKDRITITEAARAEVADAVDRAQTLWKRARRDHAPPGSELPALFTIPHGDVRRLVRLRISGGGAQSFARMPRPAESRARMRHLRAMELVMHRKSHGGSNLGPVLRDGSEHVALQVTDLTIGQGEFRQRGDPLLRVYRLASGRKSYVMSRDGAGAELVLSFDGELGSPCVLIAFLSLDSHGLAASRKMLCALASARSQVNELFWGAVAYDLSDLPAGPLPPCEPFVVRHSILVAHECGLRCEADLPALVAIGTRSGRTLLRISGEPALAAAMATEGGLGARLTRLHERARRTEWSQAPMRLFPNRMADIAARQHGPALQASFWVRKRGFRLLLIEPEGVLKTPLAAKVLADATEAACQRRKGKLCMSKNDSFVSESVAFFRALLLAPSDGSALPSLAHGSAGAVAGVMVDASFADDASVEEWVDTYDAQNYEGVGPSAGRLRRDGPRLVLVSNVGELEAQPRPGQVEPSFGPGQAARLLDTTIARLASELGVPPTELSVCTYIAPQGRETQADAELREEWNKPGGGMLRQAMRDAGVAPAEVLMVGHDYTDAQAAFAAGVGFIECNTLFGGKDLDENFVPPGQARGGCTAPSAFAEACEERNRRAARKVEADERAPASSKRHHS